MHIGYWWESQKVRDHWEDLDVGGWTILTLSGPVVVLTTFGFYTWRTVRHFNDFSETLCFKALYIALSVLFLLTIGSKCYV
jgi:hypothetical protein